MGDVTEGAAPPNLVAQPVMCIAKKGAHDERCPLKTNKPQTLGSSGDDHRLLFGLLRRNALPLAPLHPRGPRGALQLKPRNLGKRATETLCSLELRVTPVRVNDRDHLQR